MALPLAEYAMIGDRHTAALIGRSGSVDWLCLPRFDSPSCLSRLLADPHGSHWMLGPDPERAGEVRSTRRYLGDTTVLETVHRGEHGAVRVTDVMPLGDSRADITRSVEGLEGQMPFLNRWIMRFDYGRIRPWVHRDRDESARGGEVIVITAGPDKLILDGPRLPRAVDGAHEDSFTVSAGERLDFCLTWVPSHRGVPERQNISERVERTRAEQQAWADQYQDAGPDREAVLRSLLTLRSLTHEETGGIVAAATTSLPEDPGGGRNWDYRYCWLRDAALAVEAMTGEHRPDRAEPWRAWLLRAVAGDPGDLQVVYGVDGRRRLEESELDHLGGYQGSRPVRIGNGAVAQLQNDVVGEVLVALAQARAAGLEETEDSWALQRSLLDGLSGNWRRPDHGIWEIRGEPRHFTHSKMMAWAAFDAGARAVAEHGLPGPGDRWRELSEEISADVRRHGVSAETGALRQHYDTEEVDAALLQATAIGFLDPADPAVAATIGAVERTLLRDGLVLRYRTESGVDGLPGGEHPFLACSFWLVEAYADVGRIHEARVLMDRLLSLRNDVGLLSEEYDVGSGQLVGNFPQAFSHLALVQAARALRRATTAAGVRRAGPAQDPRNRT